jgi:predicted RNA-binding protein with RPS1 domain
VSVGDEVQVKVLGFSRKKRRIDLSRKALLESSQDAAALPVEVIAEDVEEDEEVVLPTAMEIALRRAMDQTGDDQRSQQKTSKATKSKREQQDDILSRTLKLSQETPK